MSMHDFIDYLTLPPRSAVPRASFDSPPIGKLLDWLVNDWSKPTVTAREAYSYGPRAIRDRETILSLALILVARGWLVPIPTRRRDMKEWQIVRGPSPTGAEAGPRATPMAKRTNLKPPPIDKLLDWLVNDWNKPTVTARDMYSRGPCCVRNREAVLRLAQSLVDLGWLVPTPARQSNTRQWQIIRESSSVTSPRDGSGKPRFTMRDLLAQEAVSLPDVSPAAARVIERFYSLADLEEPEGERS
jgi:hypothetical protein